MINISISVPRIKPLDKNRLDHNSLNQNVRESYRLYLEDSHIKNEELGRTHVRPCFSSMRTSLLKMVTIAADIDNQDGDKRT